MRFLIARSISSLVLSLSPLLDLLLGHDAFAVVVDPGMFVVLVLHLLEDFGATK